MGRRPELSDETKGSPLALVHVLGLMRTRVTLTFDGALELLRGSRDTDLQKFIFREARKELQDNDVATLRALAYFVPSASFEALMDVAKLSRNALEMSLNRLDALSLLDKLESEERYALHPLTRNYARSELLADTQTARETAMRFAKYWVAYANRYGGSAENYKTFERLEAEWPNLDAAAQWLWQTAAVREKEFGDKDAARLLNDFASALVQFLWLSWRWDERLREAAGWDERLREGAGW